MSIIKQLLYFLDKRERIQAAGLILMMVIGAGFEGFGLSMVPVFMSLLNKPETIQTNSILNRLYHLSHAESTKQFLMLAGAGLILIYAVKNLFLGFLAHSQYKFLFNKQVSLSRRLFDAYLHSPYTFHLQRNSAELLRNVNNEVLWVFHQVLIPLCVIITESLVIIVLMAVLMRLQPVPALIALVVLGSAGFVFFRFVRKGMAEAGQRQQFHLGQSIKWVNQGIGGVKEAKVLGREEYFLDFYTHSSRAYAQANRYLKFTSDLPRLGTETLAITGIMLVTLIMLGSGQEMKAILPTLGLLAVAAMRLAPSMNRIVSSLNSIRYFTPSVNVIYKDLVKFDQEPVEVRGALPQSKIGQSSEAGDIELRRVSYHYPASAEIALRNVNLTIPRGHSVAFVGPSGAGKTTIVDVILGLLSPTEGEVLVDGRNIHDGIRDWQRQIGYIPQPVYLSDDSIRRNIAFGLPDEQIEEERIQAAVRAAQLEDLVSTLDEGLDTLVGEHGVRLSGGQRQRIGIARALYHDPAVIVMDEATSALDNQTESEITRAIAQFYRKKTIIIIAHRLTTVKDCDELFFMQDGAVVRSGTYESLLATSREFQNMVRPTEARPLAPSHDDAALVGAAR